MSEFRIKCSSRLTDERGCDFHRTLNKLGIWIIYIWIKRDPPVPVSLCSDRKPENSDVKRADLNPILTESPGELQLPGIITLHSASGYLGSKLKVVIFCNGVSPGSSV